MKRKLTYRQGILLLLALFGLIIAGSVVFAVRYINHTFMEGEYEGVIEDLTIMARQIEADLKEGNPEPFLYLEMTSSVEKMHQNFSYLVRDENGVVLAPAFAAGKELPISHIHWLRRDKDCCMADVWDHWCFVVFLPLQNVSRSLELVAVYDDDYMFDEVHRTLILVAIVLISVYVLLLLLAWFLVIPAVGRMYEQKNRAEHELQMAHDLQQKAATRKFPDAPWFDIHAELRAMKDVGGDIYLCGMVGKKLGFVVGDVSDKGTAAAFVMFLLSSSIRSRIQTGVPLDQLMVEVNRLICDNPDYEMFCTLFMGTIDPDTLEMEYCNAGHTPTLLNGETIAQDPQLIAGIVPGYAYHTQKLQLHSGDRLLLYTDGVTEARDENRAFFGETRLQDWMRARPAEASCSGDCAALLDTLAAFRGKARQNDDIAIMSIRIK